MAMDDRRNAAPDAELAELYDYPSATRSREEEGTVLAVHVLRFFSLLGEQLLSWT